LGLLATAGLILAGAGGLGHLLLRGLRVPLAARSLERSVLAFGLGLSGLSLLTLGCGLAGRLSRPGLGGALALFFVAEAVCRFRERGTEPRNARQGPREPLQIPFWLCAAAPFLLCMLLGSLLPEVDFDVKEYHFEGPKEWYQQGRITFLPHNVYTSFPFLTEMLTLLGMVLQGDWYWGAIAGKAVLMCFAPLTALGLLAAGRRWFSPAAGGLAALIHLSTPWIYRISTIALAEGGLTFYLFATLLAVGLAFERFGKTAEAEPRQDGGNLRLFLLAGLLAGSAISCKYPGLISVALPLGAVSAAAPFWLKSPRPERLRGCVKIAAVFLLGAGLTFGPWLLKNAVETGNPVYPLLYNVFGGRDWDAELNAKWKGGHSSTNYTLSALAANVIDVTAKSDWLSPLLFGLAPLAWLARGRRRQVGWLWGAVGYLFLTWWLLTHRIDRFWVPLIPIVALLAGVGATWSDARRWRQFVMCVIAVCVTFNLAFVTTNACGYNAYLLDLNVAREQTAEITAPEIALLNRSLPPGSKVLCVGEAEVFDARFPLVYNTVFDRSIFQEWCGQSAPGVPARQWQLRDSQTIRDELARAGITHVYVNWQEILRYRLSYGYTDFVTPERFSELQELGILGPAWEIPAYQPWDALRPDEQREIEKWARPLIVEHAAKRAFTTFQVFPVRPGPF
jgi:4-amino-4-deoxy-L-arabinose transferase-like glycosyltransferase